MSSIVKLFVIFFLNLIPAFAPPFDGLFLPEVQKSHFERRSVTVGRRRCDDVRRLTLAKLAHVAIRQRFLSDATKQNIDSIRKGLKGKRKLTFGVFLFYEFSPLPLGTHFVGRFTAHCNEIHSDIAVPERVFYRLSAHPRISCLPVHASRLAYIVPGEEIQIDAEKARSPKSPMRCSRLSKAGTLKCARTVSVLAIVVGF